MNLESIINKAFKDVRRKVSSKELVVRCMEYGFPVELQLRSIRENFMDRFVVYSLQLLNKASSTYPSQSSKQYRNLLFYALQVNGAKIVDFLEGDPMVSFGDLHYVVHCGRGDGVVFSTRNKHDSINVSADPWIVAKLMALIHTYPIEETLYEDIYRESCGKYQICEIIESSVHKLIDDLLEGKKFRFVLTLCGTERFKLGLYEGPYIVANIYTDIEHVRADVQNVIEYHKQNPRTPFI